MVLWQPGMDPLRSPGWPAPAPTRCAPASAPPTTWRSTWSASSAASAPATLLESSFAQFQADRAVVGLAKQVRKHEEALEGYREAMTCHLGDFEEYAALRRAPRRTGRPSCPASAARPRRAAGRALAGGAEARRRHPRAGRAPGRSGDRPRPGSQPRGEGPRPLVLTIGKQVKKLSPADFPVPVEPVEHLRIPKNFNARSPKERANLVSTCHAKIGDRDLGKPRQGTRPRGRGRRDHRLRRRIRQHPCHGCDEREDHARWAERYYKLLRETEGLRRRVEGRSHVIARTFDRVCGGARPARLPRRRERHRRGPPPGPALHRAGPAHRRVPARRALGGPGPGRAGGRACPRWSSSPARPTTPASRRSPPGGVQEALADMVRLWGELEAIEGDHGLSFISEPDLGFAWAAFRWAKGHSLDAVLTRRGQRLRAGRRRLRPLDQAADRPARPDRRRRPAGEQGQAERGQGDGRHAARGGGLLVP